MIRVKYLTALVVTGLAMSLLATTATVDGITWTYTVSNGKATVGGGSSSSTAIATSISGAITVPTTLGGVPVTGIAQYAFYNCANLTSATLPDGVTSIGARAFMGCSRLSSVYVPKTIKTMGSKAFRDCVNLQSVYIESLRDWCEIVFDSPAATPLCYAHSLYINGVLAKHLTIPDGVTTITAWAFRNDNGGSVFEAIDVPGSVTSIGDAAFGGCSSLKSVTLPQIVCNNGFAATFPNSSASVTNIVISEGVTNICDSAFHDCTGLVKLVIPSSVTSIGSCAFQGCTNLVDITIPPDVNIGYKAFDGCPVEQSVVPAPEQPVVSAPEIRNVRAKQRFPWNGKVDITFEVVGDVTAGLPEWNVPHLAMTVQDRVTGMKYEASKAGLSGDVGTVEGVHHVVWDLNKQGLRIKSDDVVFTVAYAYADNRYCVIDVSAGPSATSYPVTYLAEPPSGGFNVSEYKTSKLVLKIIEPGSFKMGGSYNVTLTKPFYCGLFEVTQRQWELVMGSNPCSSTSYGKGNSYPAYDVSYKKIRGSSAGAGWPSSSGVDSSSFMGKLRARTGLDFDLPTEAQWEYACRAGTTTTYSYGNLDDGSYMWYYNNSSSKSHEVGTKSPNPWGLYDMHGNVREWCLDWYSSSLSSGVTDPKGSSSGLYRVLRGGSWLDNASDCTSSYRSYDSSGDYSSYYGFRLVRTLSN